MKKDKPDRTLHICTIVLTVIFTPIYFMDIMLINMTFEKQIPFWKALVYAYLFSFMICYLTFFLGSKSIMRKSFLDENEKDEGK